MKKIFSVVADMLVVTVFGFVLALLIAEWWVGCGENYIDSNGVRHANECLFLGKWVGR